MPSSEMLAAPSRNAVQTWAGGPGRSSAAMTSHSISSAGAMAAVPMTVGNASIRYIGVENRFLDPAYLRSPMRPCVMRLLSAALNERDSFRSSAVARWL